MQKKEKSFGKAAVSCFSAPRAEAVRVEVEMGREGERGCEGGDNDRVSLASSTLNALP